LFVWGKNTRWPRTIDADQMGVKFVTPVTTVGRKIAVRGLCG
jgi:hypothetical protein